MVNMRTVSRLIDASSRAQPSLSQQRHVQHLEPERSNRFLRVQKVWKCTCTPHPEKEAHMKPMRRTAICTLFFMALLGSVFAQKVQTDFDHQANFSRYKTYSWQEIKPANSLWDARIKNAVDAQLASKGWTRVDTDGEGAIVGIKTTQTERTLQTFYDGFGGGWRWRRSCGFGDATTTEQDYKEGALVVDLYDANTKRLIWRG